MENCLSKSCKYLIINNQVLIRDKSYVSSSRNLIYNILAIMLELNLYTPNKIQKLLSQRIRRLRLINEWTQVELAERSGISLASLKRFESTGKISLERLLLLAWTFGRLDEFTSLLEEPEIMTLADIRKLEKKRQRGKRRNGN
jgi:DNA-binding XRE family transcriptional regulator